MRIRRYLSRLALPVMMMIPGISNANIVFPALDIQDVTGNTGVALTSTALNIDATVSTILGNNSQTSSITPATFTLTASAPQIPFVKNYPAVIAINPGITYFNGSFSIGYSGNLGSLLTGSFTHLAIQDFGNGLGSIFGNITYTGGSYQGNLSVGRLEGSIMGTAIIATLGSVSTVPIPAAIWLFGSGLLGLIGIARRKTA